MEIDIIDLTEPGYADFSETQIHKIRRAQRKKNAIIEASEEKKRNRFYTMLANNTARSNIRMFEAERIDAETEIEVEELRDTLIEELYSIVILNKKEKYRYPDNPDYKLSLADRFFVVKTYYMDLTDDPEMRLQIYTMDTLAHAYLEEFYNTLYDLLKREIK